MTISIIKTEAEYTGALRHMEALWGAEVGSPDSDELELLMLVVKRWEDEHYPIAPPDPIEAIRFRMEQMGIKNAEALSKVLGLSSGRVSELLNRRRSLTMDHIRLLHRRLEVPLEALVMEYELKKPGLQT